MEDSDLVARYRALYDRNVPANGVVTPSNPPESVVKRLEGFALEWTDLPAFTKAALLWDMGLVHPTNTALDNDNMVQQVYTKCDVGATQGLSMAAIAVTKSEFESTSASETLRLCPGPTAAYARQEISSGLNLRKVTKCATMFLTTMKGGDASMWSQDAAALNAIPDPQLFRHSYDSWKMVAIHNRPRAVKEALWGTCPDVSSPGYITIPCIELNTSITTDTYCKPASSAAMERWLQELKRLNAVNATTLAPTVGTTTARPSTTFSSNHGHSMRASAALGGCMAAIAGFTAW